MTSKVETIIKRSNISLLVKRHKKHADLDLYRVLRDCLEIAEVCLKDVREYEVLNKIIKKLPMTEGQQRHYVERGSDIYQRVCRFMFHGEEHTSNTNRYAHCLREAARQGVKSQTLIQELCDGGVARFYLKRPSQSQERVVRTKCIRLDRQIEHYKSDVITLTLKRGIDNVYEVQAMKGAAYAGEGATLQAKPRAVARRA